VRLKTSSWKPAIRASTLALPDPHEWNKRHRHDDLSHCDVWWQLRPCTLPAQSIEIRWRVAQLTG